MPSPAQLNALPLLDSFGREELGGVGWPWQAPGWAAGPGSCAPTFGYFPYFGGFGGTANALYGEDEPTGDAAVVATLKATPAGAPIAGQSFEVWLRLDEGGTKSGWQLRAECEGGYLWRVVLTLWYEGEEYGPEMGDYYYGREWGGVSIEPGGALALSLESETLTVFVRETGESGWEEFGSPEGAAELGGLPGLFMGIGASGNFRPGIAAVNGGTLEAKPPPELVTPPAVTGTAQVGQTLSCSTGAWANEPTGYAYQWQRSATGIGGWSSIGVATSTYKAKVEDIGKYLRCVVTASNEGGSVEAASAATTQIAAEPPVATTQPAVVTGWDGATLHASVDANGGTTTYVFEYGLTGAYGQATASAAAGAGADPVAVETELGGLEGDTTYHFRVVATNASGTVYGADLTFTTEHRPSLLDGEEIVFTPKAGLPAELDGSFGAPPLGEAYDLGAIIAEGGTTTTDVSLQSLLRDTGLFDEA